MGKKRKEPQQFNIAKLADQLLGPGPTGESNKVRYDRLLHMVRILTQGLNVRPEDVLPTCSHSGCPLHKSSAAAMARGSFEGLNGPPFETIH